MRDKPSVTLPGKVENVIKPVGGEPEKAQITIEEADPFIRNSVLKTPSRTSVARKCISSRTMKSM
jgi:hypothetical protein